MKWKSDHQILWCIVTAVFLLISIQLKFLFEFLMIWQFTSPAITTSLRATMASVSIPSLCATSRPTNGKVVLTSPTFISTNVVSILFILLLCASPSALTLKTYCRFTMKIFSLTGLCSIFPPWVSFSLAIKGPLIWIITMIFKISEKSNCSSGQFKCRNSYCIDEAAVCDHTIDCPLNSYWDELGCRKSYSLKYRLLEVLEIGCRKCLK